MPLYGQNEGDLKYFYAGHCYQPNTIGNKVDFRLEQLDYSQYSGVWLGGDVCSEALVEYATVQYIDELFDLNNPETHWALGNHDARNGNWEYITEFTNRKTYYSYSSNKFTRIILNTNIVPTNCESMDDQYSMILDVCDTIQESAYLLLIMHHGLWYDVPGLPSPVNYSHSNLKYWNSNCKDVNSNFINSIYPLLVDVQNRGIQVVCLMGDVGEKTNRFQMKSDDDIWFIGSGLYHNEADNNVVIFNYNVSELNLSWKFHNLDSLLMEKSFNLSND
tara:strand:+ start:1058 stop:1885 length:828 start_codon:yes stop_codon:yes gene_type:complete